MNFDEIQAEFRTNYDGLGTEFKPNKRILVEFQYNSEGIPNFDPSCTWNLDRIRKLFIVLITIFQRAFGKIIILPVYFWNFTGKIDSGRILAEFSVSVTEFREDFYRKFDLILKKYSVNLGRQGRLWTIDPLKQLIKQRTNNSQYRWIRIGLF